MDAALSLLTLFGYLLATLAAGATGVLFRPGAWYRQLTKPAWTPPDWLFSVAWVVLYLAMASAAWRVSRIGGAWALLGQSFWALQIVLNAVWSPTFFGIHHVVAALCVIIALWLAVAATMGVFFTVDVAAGVLMVPYLLWVTYAAALNAAILRLNPRLHGASRTVRA
jgi:translocator protein